MGRVKFDDELGDAMERCVRKPQPFVAFYVDLDQGVLRLIDQEVKSHQIRWKMRSVKTEPRMWNSPV